MATRKRRRSSTRYAAVIRRRWKRTGRSIVRQRRDDGPAPLAAERKPAPSSLLALGGTPDKNDYYNQLGYPRYSPPAFRRGVTGPLTNGGTAVAYVVQPGDTLTRIAQTFEIPVEALRTANPELGSGDTLAVGQVISVPLTEPSFPPEPRTLIPYITQAGQSLSTIAQMFGVALDTLVRVNPQISTDGEIFVGQVIWIPTVPDAPVSQLPVILFMAQPGDTLGDIGLRFNVSLEDMVAANTQMTNPDVLNPGEIVVVPVSGVPEQPVYQRRRYVVQPGDTVQDIAARFMVSIVALEQANPILLAIPGLTLIIPEGVPIPAPPEPEPGARPCRRAPFGRRLDLGDDASTFVPFGNDFRFTFYGQTYNGVFVNSNGNVTFGEGDPNFFASVDQFVEGPPRIAPFWVDLNPVGGVAGSGVYVDVVPNDDPAVARVVITWDRVPYFFTDLPNTFQLSLYGDGFIQMCYFGITNPPDPRRILIGVARGLGEPESNIFRYDAVNNPRRTGNLQERTPTGGLSGHSIWYLFDEETGNYRLAFAK